MEIILNCNSSIPLHVEIEEQLGVLIKGEKFQNGIKLPNEVDLSRQLGISRTTLRQSMNKLVCKELCMHV